MKVLDFRVELKTIRLIARILLIVVGFKSCGTNLIIIKMQRQRDKDSELSSLLSSDEEENTALSSYYKSEVAEGFGNINEQASEKAKFYANFNINWEWIQYNRRKLRRDGYYNSNAQLDKASNPLNKQQREILNIELLPSEHIKTEEDAVHCYKLLINGLAQN